MAINVIALGAAKSYTDETAQGGGAIAGKNCTISKIERNTTDDASIVTFQWTLDNGTVQTGQMTVKDGKQGVKGDKGDNADLSNLKEGSNITIKDNGDGTYTISATGDIAVDYSKATNKPSINGVTLDGNKTTADLKIESGKIDVIKVNGTAQTITDKTVDISVPKSIDDLSDVVLTSVAKDDFLMYDENAKAFVNKNMPTIPSKTSDLTNDSKFQTEDQVNEKIADVELVKIPNVTIFGNPNIQHGQVTNFSATNFVQMPFEFDMTDKAFDFIVCFTPYATSGMPIVNTEEDTGGMMITSKSTGITVNVFDKDNNQLVTSSIPLTVEVNKTYFVKVSWNKLQYTVSHSVDGGNTYVVDTTTPSAVPPGPCHLAFGRKGTLFLNGSINLNKCELYINGLPYWEGMDDVGMATRLATDLANITDDGVDKINDIVGDNFVNKTSVVKAFNTTTTDTNIPSEKLVKDSLDAIEDKVDELQLYKFPNAIIIGDPTINNGQISNFSNSDYLKFPFLVDFNNKPFEINMAFTTGTNVTNQENIFDSDFGLAFAIRNSHFVIAISSNGTNWNIGEGVGTYTILPNTAYRVKLAWDGSQYTLDYSTDGGESYTRDITKASTEQPYPKQIFIGVGQSDTSVLNHFTGIINMNRAELSIDGTVRWQGMDDVGLSTRLATDVSNIDESGVAKIKEIVGKPDTSNIEKTIAGNWNDTGYNLIPYPYYRQDGYVRGGITYSVLSDGTVIANGTATEISLFALHGAIAVQESYVLKKGTYRLTGCPEGGSTTTYRLLVDDETASKALLADTGSGNIGTFTEDTNVTFIIAIYKNTVCENLTFRPMLVEVNEDGSYPVEYQRYASGNTKLTDEISRKELELAELKMLGWNVDTNASFTNSVRGNIFTQNVARVRFDDLEALGTFGTDNHCFRFKPPVDIKKEWAVAVYIDGYKAMFPRDYAGWIAEEDKTVGLLSTYDVICMKDNSCSTADEFVAKLTGKYIYYLLATPITKQIDGNEIIEKDIVTAKVNNFVKPTSDAEILALSNGIYSINVDDTSLLPSRWGTLIVLKSGYVYGSMIFITTSQEYYFRNINNGAWRETAWQKLTTTATEHTISYTTTSGTSKTITVFGK